MTDRAKTMLRIALQIVLAVLLAAGLYVAWSQPDPLDARPERLPEGWDFLPEPNYPLSMVEDGETVWAGLRDGLVQLDRDTGKVLRRVDADVALSHVRALLVDSTGRLWAGHDMGLTCVDGPTVTTFSEGSGLPDRAVNALARADDGRLMVGSSRGAVLWDPSTHTAGTPVEGLLRPMVNCVMQHPADTWWFGSYGVPDGGVTILGPDARQTFTVDDGLPHPYVTSMKAGPDGSVWVGCGFGEEGGLARFEPRENGWRLAAVYKKKDGLPGNKVRSLLIDDSGRLWAGTEYDGLALRSGDAWRPFREALAHPEILVLLQDSTGRIWIGTQPGITRLTPRALETGPQPN